MLFTSVWLRLVNAGIVTPPAVEPFCTNVRTMTWLGLSASRFGAAVPVAPAAASVWHDAQLLAVKTAAPATGSPWSASGPVVVGAVVAGGGVVALPTVSVPFMPAAAWPGSVQRY